MTDAGVTVRRIVSEYVSAGFILIQPFKCSAGNLCGIF